MRRVIRVLQFAQGFGMMPLAHRTERADQVQFDAPAGATHRARSVPSASRAAAAPPRKSPARASSHRLAMARERGDGRFMLAFLPVFRRERARDNKLTANFDRLDASSSRFGHRQT